MNRVLKTLLLWLLIAALPIQGMAAVVKASCGPAHHAMPSAPPEQAWQRDDDAMPRVHHAHAMHADMAAAAEHHAAPAMDDGPHGSRQVEKDSCCSACAACCFGAVAPPPAVAWKPVLSRSHLLFTPAIVRVAGHIPAGLERPPRQLSA